MTWILDVSDDPYPPSSNSISWGQSESGVAKSTFNTFNTEAKSLGARGVTIVVSSGDNGVTYNSGSCNTDSSSSNFKWKVSCFISVDISCTTSSFDPLNVHVLLSG